MSGPMEGVRIVELGIWVAAPSAAGMLCDWGAEVIKIEPPEGDPMRGVGAAYGSGSENPAFDLDNRGKRSVALDLQKAEARDIAHQLLAAADVFVTNIRPGGLRRIGMDYATLGPRYPRLIYAQLTGYGLGTPDEDRPAYDGGAYWSRAGVIDLLTAPGADFPLPRGGMGDHTAGTQLCAGISAALYARERSGRGGHVHVSLLRAGMYTAGWDLNAVLRTGTPAIASARRTMPNPMVAPYRAADGNAMWLLGFQADRHWGDFCRALNRPEWENDERYDSIPKRAMRAEEMIAQIDVIMATKTRAEWGAIFDQHDIWWGPIQSAAEVIADPGVRAAGGFVEVPLDETASVEMIATPVDYPDTPWVPRRGAPQMGQHTEEVLLDLGLTWEDISGLKERGAII